MLPQELKDMIILHTDIPTYLQLLSQQNPDALLLKEEYIKHHFLMTYPTLYQNIVKCDWDYAETLTRLGQREIPLVTYSMDKEKFLLEWGQTNSITRFLMNTLGQLVGIEINFDKMIDAIQLNQDDLLGQFTVQALLKQVVASVKSPFVISFSNEEWCTAVNFDGNTNIVNLNVYQEPEAPEVLGPIMELVKEYIANIHNTADTTKITTYIMKMIMDGQRFPAILREANENWSFRLSKSFEEWIFSGLGSNKMVVDTLLEMLDKYMNRLYSGEDPIKLSKQISTDLGY